MIFIYNKSQVDIYPQKRKLPHGNTLNSISKLIVMFLISIHLETTILVNKIGDYHSELLFSTAA